MLVIDGAMGEGGGQVLRTSLALSLITGRAFRIERIRANRARPGLRRQHLTAVQAAASIGAAEVRGDQVGSSELDFEPHGVSHAGSREHRFDVKTAGSATLVVQTILLPLLSTRGRSRVVVLGGTHNDKAPSYDYLDRVFLPLLRSLGARVRASMIRPGFYPAGGGEIRLEIEGPTSWRPLELHDSGALHHERARILISKLPEHVAEREADTIRDRLGWSEVEIERVTSPGPGNVVLLEHAREHVTEVFTGFGRRDVRAEKVARNAIGELRTHVETGAPVGPHLADQLLLPLALGAGGSFRTGEPTLHTRTNADVIRAFLDVEIELTPPPASDGCWRVDVRPG
jgi:RNA 3'-terminal phosphate cyclase (ATP)